MYTFYFSSSEHKLKMSSSFYCLLLTISAPTDDFLWSHSSWFVSRLMVEAPPCLPSSLAKLLTDVWKCQELKSPLFQRETARFHGSDSQSLWTVASFHAPFSSLRPQKMEAWWSDWQTFAFDMSRKICWCSQSRVCWRSSIMVVLSDHSTFFGLREVQQRQLREQIN